MLAAKKSSEKKEYIYRQIYAQFKREILLHHFLPNEKLPSKRELADNLNVSINSVTSAYQQLLAEGYIYAIERSGYYVEKLDAMPQIVKTNNPLSPELIESQNTKGETISFSHMSADKSVFPFDSWLSSEHKAVKSKGTELNDDPTRYPQGVYSVRKSIARLLSITRGVKCFPEQIILGAGTQVLMQMLSHLLPDRSIYAMEDPGYKRIYLLLKKQQLNIKTIRLDDKGVSIDEIRETNSNIIYTTPSHQFPTGIVMPISRRIQLLNWASENENRYIIEDDYDSEFKYQSDLIPSLQGLDNMDKVIYLGTFSKSLLPGLRISYMVLPQKLLKKHRSEQRFQMQTCNILAQLTLQQFIRSGEYNKHIKRMKQIYEKRRIRLIQELTDHFGKNMTIHGANAGLHFLATFCTDRSIDEILHESKKEKLEIYSIRRCYLNHSNLDDEKATFILGYANLPLIKIPEGVNRLYRAVCH